MTYEAGVHFQTMATLTGLGIRPRRTGRPRYRHRLLRPAAALRRAAAMTMHHRQPLPKTASEISDVSFRSPTRQRDGGNDGAMPRDCRDPRKNSNTRAVEAAHRDDIIAR